VTIRDPDELVRRVIGYEGRLVFDASKPDGPLRNLLDGSRLQAMGWHASSGLEQGIAQTYDWFLAHARRGPLEIAT